MIFIVDSDPATRDALRFLLETEGLRSEGFASATAFLDRWSPSDADYVILDVDMPEMRSLDLIERMQARGSRLPVVVMISLPTLASTRHLDAVDATRLSRSPIRATKFCRRCAPPSAAVEAMKSVRSLVSKEQLGGIIGAGIWFGLWLGLVIFPSPRLFFANVESWYDWLYSIGGAIGLWAAGQFGAFVGRAVEGHATRSGKHSSNT